MSKNQNPSPMRPGATDAQARELTASFAPISTELPKFDGPAGDADRLLGHGVTLSIVNGVLCIQRRDLPRAIKLIDEARSAA